MRIRFLSIAVSLCGHSLPCGRPKDAVGDLPGTTQSYLISFIATASRWSLVSDAVRRIGLLKLMKLSCFLAQGLTVALALQRTYHINRRWGFT